MKQLLFILTTDADGGVPVHFCTADGNTNDSITHIETWTTLRSVAGRADFLYVADSKLCSYDNLSFIDRAGGRFVTVLPRSRREDKHFRKLLRHTLLRNDKTVQSFPPQLTDIQLQTLNLLGVPVKSFVG